MVNNKDESISALVDDELQQDELDAILTHLGDDSELRQQWHRYNLISDALHKNLTTGIDPDFHKHVTAAIENEPTILAPRRIRRRLPDNWVKQAAGLGIAASVTAVAILGIQQMNQDEGQQPVIASAPAPQQYVRITQPVSSQPENNAELDAYLVNHNELSSSSGIRGALPYARIVSHGIER